jgi:hypothetical protein
MLAAPWHGVAMCSIDTSDFQIDITYYSAHSESSNVAPITYTLTNKEIRVLIYGRKERGSIALKDSIKPNEVRFTKILKVNLDALQDWYTGRSECEDCPEDILVITIKTANKVKNIQTTNYYVPEIRAIIDVINSLVPAKYKLTYEDNFAK